MSLYYQDENVVLHHGDCIEVMRSMPAESVDSIVTDPPYGLGFMGKKWDAIPPGEEWARECLRVLKPGGHIIAFGGSRTWHRLAVAIEDAGFEIRDGVLWLYGSGFPKSMDVSKAIDKARDEDEGPRLAVTTWTREQCEARGWTRKRLCDAFGVKNQPIQSWTEKNPKNAIIPTWENWQKLKSLVGFGDDMDAEVWRLNGRKGQPGENWGRREVLSERETTFLARKKADGTTVSGDMLMASERGVATIRETLPATDAAKQWSGWGTALKPAYEPAVMARKPFKGTVADNVLKHGTGAINIDASRIGATPDRFPANLILDEHTAELLDEQAEASKFFYVAKAPKSERPVVDGIAHPTVKPLSLMRHLVKLVTPAGGVILDPFAGSGTTIEAALLEGFNPIGIEMETDYLPLIQHRINRVNGGKS